MSVDTLSLARELRAAEIEPSQAEAIAAAIGRAVVEPAATKSDFDQFGAVVRAEVKQVETGLRTEIGALGVKLDTVDTRQGARSDLLSSNIKTEVAKLDTKIEAVSSKPMFWFIGTQLAVGGLVVALIKLLPAQG